MFLSTEKYLCQGRMPKHPICCFSLTSSDPLWLQDKEMGLNLKNLTQVVKAHGQAFRLRTKLSGDYYKRNARCIPVRSDLKSGRDFVPQREHERTLHYCCCSVWSQTLCDSMDTRLPHPSRSPGVCADSCPLSRRRYPTVLSSVTLMPSIRVRPEQHC